MNYNNDPEYLEFLMYKNYEYEKLENGTYRILECKNKEIEEAIIPAVVSEVAAGCFSRCTELVRVEFLCTLETLEDNLFYGCTSLEEIVFPKGLKNIGRNTFSYCKSLGELILPEGLEYIGREAFSNCDGLNDIYIPASVKVIDRDAFLECREIIEVDISDVGAWCNVCLESYKSSPLYYGASLTLRGDDIEGLEIPESVTQLMPFVFANCDLIELVLMPRFLNSISPLAFYHCSGIERFEIDSRNKRFRVVDDAFVLSGDTLVLAADSMETFPEEIAEIAPGAFAPCSFSPALEVERSDIRISKGSLFGLESLEELKIPLPKFYRGGLSFSELYDYEANNWDKIEMAEMPTKLAYYCLTGGDTLHGKTFSGLKSIQKLILPEGLERIEGSPFLGVNIPSLEIPDSVSFIESGSGLSKIRLKVGRGSPYKYSDGFLVDSRTSTLVSAGYGKGYIPSGIKRIGEGAFRGDDKLKEIRIDGSIIEIGKLAFAGCTSLKSVIFGNGIKKIYCSCLYSCESLESIYFEDQHILWYLVPNFASGEREMLANVRATSPMKDIIKIFSPSGRSWEYLIRK